MLALLAIAVHDDSEDQLSFYLQALELNTHTEFEVLRVAGVCVEVIGCSPIELVTRSEFPTDEES